MELNELHILQRQSRTGHHAAAVTGTGVRRSGREIGAAIAASRQYNHLRIEDMHRTVVELPANNTLTLTVFRHDQIDGKILDVEFCVVLQRLAVKRVQDRVTGPVRRCTSPLNGRAFAEFGGVTAKRALITFALFGPAKRNTVMLKFVNRLRGLTREVFHRVRVTQPVRALYSVIHMPLPVIRSHVAKRGSDATLRRNSVRTGRENLGYASRAQALLGHAQCCAQSSTTGANNNHVIFVGFVFVCSHDE